MIVLPKKYYPELDGLRAIAVFLVVAFHARGIAEPQGFADRIVHKFLESGWIGVDLFFVLSGLLITGILFDTVERKEFLIRFYVRRGFRIFPIYYLSLILVPVVFYLLDEPHFAGPVDSSYWLFVQNWLHVFDRAPDERFGHFWSLAVEEQFYIVWPLLFLALYRHKRALHAFAGLIGASILFRIFLVHYDTHNAGFFSTVSHIDGLVAGAALAYVFRQGHDSAKLRQFFTMILTASPVSLLAVFIVAHGFDNRNEIVLVYGVLSLSVFFCSVVALTLILPEDGTPRAFLRAPWLTFTGRISYGIYVYHWPLTLILMRVWPQNDAGYLPNQFWFFCAVWCASLYLAWLSRVFIEKPILDLRERLVHNPSEPVTPRTLNRPAPAAPRPVPSRAPSPVPSRRSARPR